jgi:hypothetical protein
MLRTPEPIDDKTLQTAACLLLQARSGLVPAEWQAPYDYERRLGNFSGESSSESKV